jgi:hypothetical protein
MPMASKGRNSIKDLECDPFADRVSSYGGKIRTFNRRYNVKAFLEIVCQLTVWRRAELEHRAVKGTSASF